MFPSENNIYLADESTNIEGLRKQVELLLKKVQAIEEGLILNNDPLEEFRLNEILKTTQEELSASKKRLREALIQEKQQSITSDEPAEKDLFHDYHRYTCDRVVQNDSFFEHYKQQVDHKAQFFYIYGLDRQSHISLFRRFSYELQGLLQAHLNPDLMSSCKVERAEVTFDFSNNESFYKENIIKGLFAAFSLNPNDQEPLLERNLCYLLEKSPSLNALGKEDYVCCYLSISEWDWDAEITPKVVNWIMNAFCADKLPANSPTFLFFFGVEFEDEDSEVKDEVEEAIREGGKIVRLPELHMVKEKDIRRWVSKYRQLAPSGKERRALFKKHFKDDAEYFMDDVEIELKRIIDLFNKHG